MNLNLVSYELFFTTLELLFIYLSLKEIHPLPSKKNSLLVLGVSWILFNVMKLIHQVYPNESFLLPLHFIVEFFCYYLLARCWKEHKQNIFFYLTVFLCIYQFFFMLLDSVYFFVLLPGNWEILQSDFVVGSIRFIPYPLLWWTIHYKQRLLRFSKKLHLYQKSDFFFFISFVLHFTYNHLDHVTNVYILSWLSVLISILIGQIIHLEYQKELYSEQSKYLRMKNNPSIRQQQKQYEANLVVQQNFIEQLDEIQMHYKTDPKRCLEILDQIQNDIVSTSHIENKNNFLSAFLDFKMHAMKLHGIHVKLFLDSTLERMSPFHITTILGNLLDNALEAQKHVINRNIAIDISEDANQYYIQIRNQYHPRHGSFDKKTKEWLTTKPNKENHGNGLKNVKACVAQLNGICTIEARRNTFQVSITIPKGESLC